MNMTNPLIVSQKILCWCEYNIYIYYFCLKATLPKPGRSNMLPCPWSCMWILFRSLFCRLLFTLKSGCEIVRCNSKTSEILPRFPKETVQNAHYTEGVFYLWKGWKGYFRTLGLIRFYAFMQYLSTLT